ncbi:MAG TPA: hypothetical protein P5179_06235, partial [Candidatus Latescibacteria bacterium]|nr:hypothetical protein [Candidatus Latescibacterota bacterium]
RAVASGVYVYRLTAPQGVDEEDGVGPVGVRSRWRGGLRVPCTRGTARTTACMRRFLCLPWDPIGLGRHGGARRHPALTLQVMSIASP